MTIKTLVKAGSGQYRIVKEKRPFQPKCLGCEWDCKVYSAPKSKFMCADFKKKEN